MIGNTHRTRDKSGPFRFQSCDAVSMGTAHAHKEASGWRALVYRSPWKRMGAEEGGALIGTEMSVFTQFLFFLPPCFARQLTLCTILWKAE
ncbi:hypothetical protein BaRGS_00027896 [Batillaria attramentaria]|uniref:Uncharacterized protein n=1 Tax=Batillaria attramentaria TaxID=370345 RepID=A0ABD0K220_9CAEN